jgi:teichuronic acid biosynthesis glycosyltransferase TuaC
MGEARDPSKLRLLVLAVGYPTPTYPAGVFHHEQFQLLAASGADVTVVVPTPWVPPLLAKVSRWRRYVDAPSRQVDGDVVVLRPRYLTFPRENHWFTPDITQYWAVKALGLPRFDVVHGFHILPLGAVARRLAKHWSVPFVTTALGDDVNVYPHLNSRNLRLLGDVVADAAVTYANGKTLARETARLANHAVQDLPLGISAKRFRNLPDRAEARRRLNLPNDRPIALYVGRLVAGKGIEELATALDRLQHKNVLGVVVGSGPLQGVLDRCTNARLLGSLPPHEVALAMAAADLLVLPSHSEGLPTVLMEAALASLPIVTTNAPGCIDLAGEGRALVVPVGDAAALTGAIEAVIADPAAAQARAHAMRTHVEAYGSLENNTARLMACYRELVAVGKGREAAA